MKKIKLSKIQHRDEDRIRVEFEKNFDLITKIKTIAGRRWSKTKNCWHLPYCKASFENLKSVFGESQLEFERRKDQGSENAQESQKSGSSIINPIFLDFRINGKVFKKVIGEKIIILKQGISFIEAYVPHDKKGWTETIRNISGRQWNPQKAYWLLPNVKVTFRYLYRHIGKENLIFNFKINKNIPEEFHKPTYQKRTKKVGLKLLDVKQKAALDATMERIVLKRYSPATLKSYKAHLTAIFLFFDKKAPDSITPKDIEDYLVSRIRFKKISESTQNQIISSYKIYAELVLNQPKQFIKIQRPKKPKDLPNILSTEEVIRLVETPRNIKHQLILLLIYSAGLRLGEVVSIRVRDISLYRRTIFIKAGKGKKDRFVTLAEEVISYLKSYKKAYNPVYWLFEGQYGGKYSKRSVQAVFRKALEQSKINAYATVHTLRHSYATHCIENGFSTAMVQQALGHSSIKTTEKYLHLSSNALRKLTSPLDIIRKKGEND